MQHNPRGSHVPCGDARRANVAACKKHRTGVQTVIRMRVCAKRPTGDSGTIAGHCDSTNRRRDAALRPATSPFPAPQLWLPSFGFTGKPATSKLVHPSSSSSHGSLIEVANLAPFAASHHILFLALAIIGITTHRATFVTAARRYLAGNWGQKDLIAF